MTTSPILPEPSPLGLTATKTRGHPLDRVFTRLRMRGCRNHYLRALRRVLTSIEHPAWEPVYPKEPLPVTQADVYAWPWEDLSPDLVDEGLRPIEGTGSYNLAATALRITAKTRLVTGWVCAAQAQAIEVKNGSVTKMGDAGLELGTGARVENVRAQTNGGDGIVTSNGSAITGCVAQRNGGAGFSVFRGNTISESAAVSNGGDGISGDSRNTISNSPTFNNGGHGISLGAGSSVTGSVASANGDDGISVSNGSVLRHNTAYLNDNRGIDAGDDVAVSGNSASTNGDGDATDDGINCGSGCLVENNTSSNNDGFGMRMGAATSGYRANVTRINSQGAVSGGSDLGSNLLN